ncbi:MULTISPECIES: hypothetical protein [Haematobacter]|uniref:Uncharacterized protein n=1 Tax=Haematobacter massiliensis TaxID=195105 RepID=A0A086Y8S6_9RHOB|nr:MULTISPECIES: hypothetical protein [Haematobacter]KFI30676.1 hypothetical protein CN97_12610 [Haematobacter massiliensis]OWJ87416.1 hypothetical protein CDV51_06725 [Haematobacter massiliensis]QBJ24871.1 hypothetical protein HmaOT1_11830 [Haematobacter massiliensis]
MPVFAYSRTAVGDSDTRLTGSVQLAALLSEQGYAVEQWSVVAGEYTTSDTQTAQPFTATSSSGLVTIEGIMPPGARLIYTDDPQRQAIILLPAGGTVTVNSRTPATTADEYGRTIHGSTVNIGVMTSSVGLARPHGYDGRSRPGYTQVNDTYSQSKLATFPVMLTAGDVINCALSEVPLLSAANGSLITEYLSLTVMEGTAPSGDLFAPQVCRAAGVAPVLTGIDIDAIYDSLPRYDASETSPPADLDLYLQYAEKFQGSLRANYQAGDGTFKGGYGEFMPNNSGFGGTGYGRGMSQVAAGLFPLLWTNAGTEEQTKRALRAIISSGIQQDGINTGPNGGIWTTNFPMIYLARHFTGKSLSSFVMGAKGVAPQSGGNVLGQFYQETAQNLLRYRTPHTNSSDPVICNLREVLAVNGQDITVDNTANTSRRTSKLGFRGLLLKSQDGTKSNRMTGPTPGNASGNSFVVTVEGAHTFVVGEQVWFSEDGTLVPGDPNWSIRWRDNIPTYTHVDNPAAGADYRKQAVGGDFVLVAQALGIVQPSWTPVVQYAKRTLPIEGAAFGIYPSEFSPYSHIFEGETIVASDDPTTTWGMRLWRKHWSTLETIPQIGA